MDIGESDLEKIIKFVSETKSKIAYKMIKIAYKIENRQRLIGNAYTIHQIFLQLKRVRLNHVRGHVLMAYFLHLVSQNPKKS